MKKILIVGANGMLGQEMVKVFSAQGGSASGGKKDKDYKVIAWDRKDLDVTKEKAVWTKIKIINPEIIINTTAYNAVDKCETDKKELKIATDVNGKAPGYLAKAAKKIGATLVHYSTDYVFDGNPKIPEPEGCTHSCGSCSLHKGFVPEIGFDENAKPKPINKYGKTKLMGEKEVQKNMKNFYIIRISKLFGKRGIFEGAKKNFFDFVLDLAKQGETVKGVVDETSCFTYAPDLAKKTKEIIDSKKPFGIYHIFNTDACNGYEAALELVKQAKIKKANVVEITAEELNRPASRPFYSALINTKLNPMRSYKDALKEYLKSLRITN